MRYGIIQIPLKILEEILLISKDSLKQNIRRITELPDDAHIIGIEYKSTKQMLEVLIAGSGNDLVKVPDGGCVPIIAIAVEDVSRL